MSMPRSNEIATWNKLHTNPREVPDEALHSILSNNKEVFNTVDQEIARVELNRRKPDRASNSLKHTRMLADVIAKEGPANDLSLTFIKGLSSNKLRRIVDGTVPYLPDVIKAAKDELSSRGEMWKTVPPIIGNKADKAIIDEPAQPSALDIQHGGEHYKQLGNYQPWEVLKVWLTPEEFRGFMKGTAIAYLAREQSKGKDMDIAKAVHTLQGYQELAGDTKDGNDKR